MFQLIPQAVAGRGKVPGTSLYEKAILYLALKQKGVKDFILPVICNHFMLSYSIKIFIFIIWFLLVRFPKILYFFISILLHFLNVIYFYEFSVKQCRPSPDCHQTIICLLFLLILNKLLPLIRKFLPPSQLT